MGFGSYDESEQEQPGDKDQEANGEDVTDDIKGDSQTHHGSEELEYNSDEEMFKHL